MILREYLDQADPDKVLYVGSGVGALIGGVPEQIMEAIPALDAELEAKQRGTALRAQQKYDEELKYHGEKSKKTKAAKARFDKAILPYVPLLDRNILSTYERTTENATNVRIEGDEPGSVWSVKEGTEEWRHVEIKYHVEDLAAAIIKAVVDDYKFAFRNELAELKDCLDRLKEYRERSEIYEKEFFHEDIKRLIGADPDFIIRRTRQIVAEELKESTEQLIGKEEAYLNGGKTKSDLS